MLLVPVLAVPFQRGFPWAVSLSHILLCQIQGIWPEAEVFDPFGVKFGEG